MTGPRGAAERQPERERDRDEAEPLEKQLDRTAPADPGGDDDAADAEPRDAEPRDAAGGPGMGPGPATGIVEPRDPLSATRDGAPGDDDDDVPSVPEQPSPDGDDA